MSVDNIWYTRCPLPSASAYGLHNGLLAEDFRDLGIGLTELGSGDKEQRRAHLSQQIPNLIRQGGNIPPLIARSLGADFYIVAFSWPNTSRQVLVRADSDIEGIADLRGKKLAVPVRPDDEYDFIKPSAVHGYQQILGRAGLGLDDIQLIEFPIPGRFRDNPTVQSVSGQGRNSALSEGSFHKYEVAALLRGDVDAISADGAAGAQFQHLLGLRDVVDIEPANGEVEVGNAHPLVMTASGPIVRDQPDLLIAWFERIVQAPRWVRDHQDDARRIFAFESFLPEDLVPRAFPGRLEAQLVLDVEDASIAAYDRQNHFLHEQGIIDAPVDLSDFIRTDLLEKVLAETGPQL